MAIDPTIALQTRIPEMQSPMQTLGNAALFEDRAASMDERRQQAEIRRQQNEDRAAIMGALQQNPNDPDAAIQSLYRMGRATAAGQLSKDLLDSRNAESDGISKLVDSHKKTIDFVTDMLAGADDQQSYDTVRAGAEPILQKSGLGNLMALLPPKYDPDTVKKVLAMGSGASKKLDLEKKATDNLHAANENVYAGTKSADEHAAALQKRRDDDTKTAATVLSQTTSQQDLDGKQRMLASQGVAPDILARFGNQWSPQYGANALKVGMTPGELAQDARAKTTEDLERQRVGIDRDRLTFEQSGGAAAARGITPAQRDQIEQSKQAEYDKLAKDYANPKNVPDDVQTALANLSPTAKVKPDERAAAKATVDAWQAKQNQQLGQAKLQIENSYRAKIGLPSLQDTEAAIKARIANGQALPSDAMDLRIVRNKYRIATGQKTPLEQMDDLGAQIQRTTDPVQKATLLTQLKTLRKQYVDNATSPTTAAAAPGGSQDQSPDDDE